MRWRPPEWRGNRYTVQGKMRQRSAVGAGGNRYAVQRSRRWMSRADVGWDPKICSTTPPGNPIPSSIKFSPWGSVLSVAPVGASLRLVFRVCWMARRVVPHAARSRSQFLSRSRLSQKANWKENCGDAQNSEPRYGNRFIGHAWGDADGALLRSGCGVICLFLQ